MEHKNPQTDNCPVCQGLKENILSCVSLSMQPIKLISLMTLVLGQRSGEISLSPPPVLTTDWILTSF